VTGRQATVTRSRRGVAVPAVAAAPATPPPVLGGLPPVLRQELIDELNKIERHYREGRWEPAELDGGRLTEVVYSIVKGHLDAKMPGRSSKPAQMVQAIQRLEGYPASAGPRSMRILIPRVLLGILDIRNDRDVGHVGGEVPSNHMDATYVLNAAKWLVAELVRIFHQVDISTATEFVEALIERDTPAVWEVVPGVKRVLNTKMSVRDRVLLLLHASPGPVRDTDLRDWSEYSNAARFRSGILGGLHDEKFIDYETATGLVRLSETGARYVEARLPAWKV
jgi:hypothetical protein